MDLLEAGGRGEWTAVGKETPKEGGWIVTPEEEEEEEEEEELTPVDSWPFPTKHWWGNM